MTPETITVEGRVLPVITQPEDFFRHTGNVFIKRMYLEKAGNTCVGHAHKHAHISLLAHGVVGVKITGNDAVIYRAPAFIDVAAGLHHQFIAVEDDTVLYCVHDTHGLDVEDLGVSYA